MPTDGLAAIAFVQGQRNAIPVLARDRAVSKHPSGKHDFAAMPTWLRSWTESDSASKTDARLLPRGCDTLASRRIRYRTGRDTSVRLADPLAHAKQGEASVPHHG